MKCVIILFVLTVLSQQRHNEQESLKCSSENVMYLFTCKTYPEQYTGSRDAFRQEFNNHKCVHRNFFQAIVFNTHFMEASHNVGNDLKGRLIDQTHDLEERKKKEHFWQDELYILENNEFNECKVPLLFSGFSTQIFKMVFTRKFRDAFMVILFS